MAQQDFQLEGPYIQLNNLIKLLGLAESGGAAKIMIAAGDVNVDGVLETRKRLKLRVGQVVKVGEEEIRIVA